MEFKGARARELYMLGVPSMSAMGTTSYYCPTRIVMGSGVHKKIAGELSAAGVERVLLVVDPAVAEGQILASVRESFDALGIVHDTFSDIEPDPSDITVAAALDFNREHGGTAITAIGGGSAMDVAKAVGIVTTNGGRIHDYEGIMKYQTAPLPLLAMPTTAGTGSEVSGSCVISDTERSLKMSIRHASLNPARVAFLDPLAVTTVPEHVAMHSGVDAFVHAFESFISKRANPVTDALNLRAIEQIHNNILRFVKDRSDLDAGMAMLSGSAMAGMAFGLTGLGNVHCIARFVGAFFHVSHGLSNAVCLSEVARFNRPACVERYARLAKVLSPTAKGDSEALSHICVDAITALCRDLGVPENLRAIGAKRDQLEDIADLCAGAGYEQWNPRKTSRSDFLEILETIY
ncbi:iron-containing alcohol dehydrogenase [Planktomarina temperata]|nr:iron-containing alcohol dehydrogenase [Planktomarina temperata]